MRNLIAMSFCLLLVACGGGSGSNGNGSNLDPTGIWLGSFTQSGGSQAPVIGFIFRNQIHLISNDESSGLVYQGIAGMSGRNLNAVTENRMADAGMGSPILSSYQIRAELLTVAGIRNIRGTYTSSNSTRGTILLTYDPITDRGSSLEAIADNWGAVNTGGAGGLSLTIDSAGRISGSVGESCVYNGQVEIIDSAINIYGVDLLIESCTEASNNGNHTGFAFIDDRGANRQLFLSAIKIDEATPN